MQLIKSDINTCIGLSHGVCQEYLTIIPQAQMDYWLRGNEGDKNYCFSKIFQLVGQKYQDKTTWANKTRFSHQCCGFQSRRFTLLVGYNI